MNKRKFIEEILDTLRNMDDAIEVIINLDADAVMNEMDEEVE